MLHREEHAIDIHRHLPPPDRIRHLRHRAHDGDPRIRHQDMQATETLPGHRRNRGPASFARDIMSDEDAIDLRGDALPACLLDIGQYQLRARACQETRARRADAGSGAGDYGDLAVQLPHAAFFSPHPLRLRATTSRPGVKIACFPPATSVWPPLSNICATVVVPRGAMRSVSSRRTATLVKCLPMPDVRRSANGIARGRQFLPPWHLAIGATILDLEQFQPGRRDRIDDLAGRGKMDDAVGELDVAPDPLLVADRWR